MDEWEKEHILNNFSGLMKATTVRPTLLADLRAKQAIGDGDVDELQRSVLSEHERSSRLLRLMLERTNGFQILRRALLSDSQTGAYGILQAGPVARHSGSLPKELATTTILFSTILPDIEGLLDDANCNILIVSTPDVPLSLKRISDVGKNYLIVHADKNTRLSKRTFHSMDEETAQVIPVDHVETTLKRLEGSATNAVLLTKESVEEIDNAVGYSQRQNMKVVRETISWVDITPAAQELVLQQRVKFQNKIISLNQLTPDILPIEEMKGQIMFDLLNGICPELLKNSVPSCPAYYVPRKISSRVNLSRGVFQDPGQDVIVVEGIELYQLANLTLLARNRNRGGEVVSVARSSEQLETLTAQFIQLEHVDDYEDICELSKNPVHWISHHSGEFTWRKSYNSLGVIQKYIRDSQNHIDNEDDFVSRCLKSESPICIADSPGMGKTLLLTRIAEKVQSESTCEYCVVRFLVLRDLIQDNMQNQLEIDMEYACQLIAKSCSDYELGRQIVFKALKTEKVRCHVFLDGYDELLSNQISTVNQLLKCLAKLKNTQLYVSTRLNRYHELEDVLITTGCHVKPFDIGDQVTFLIRYWEEAGAAKNNDKLGEFAKSALKKVKEHLTEAERDIAGIPLQCRLLAEIYTKKAKQASEGRKFLLAKHHSSSSTLFAMFQAFMELGFGKVDDATMRKQVRRAHMLHAIQLLFPPDSLQPQLEQTFLLAETYLTFEDNSILFAPGILEKAEAPNKCFRFIHRTLAEYLVANFIIEFLETAIRNPFEEVVATMLLRTVFSTRKTYVILLKHTNQIEHKSIGSQEFKFSVICYFLNASISAKGVGLLSTSAGAAAVLNIFSVAQLGDIFIASVAANFPAITSYFLHANLGHFQRLHFPWSGGWFPLAAFLLAGKYAGTELMGQLAILANKNNYMQFQITKIVRPVRRIYNEKLVPPLLLTPLHVAAHWGNFNVASILLDSCGFRELLVGERQRAKYLLHVCVRNSWADAETVAQDKIQIIRRLCSEDEHMATRHILEDRLPSGRTPLLQKGVHPRLIQTLIQVGADVNAVNWENKCVLHTAVKDGFHELVETLSQTTTNFKHYNLQSNRHGTPLRRAIAKLDELEMRTVDLLVEMGADVNHVWGGESILFSALWRGSSKEVVQGLAARGAHLRCNVIARALNIPCKVMESVEYIIDTTPTWRNSSYCWRKQQLNPDPNDPEEKRLQHQRFIGAQVDLQEMKNQQLSSSFVLSLLHNNGSSSSNNNSTHPSSVEPCFTVHSLSSQVIASKVWKDEDSWALAFNYNKISQNNDAHGNVAECTAKVVLLTQKLIDEIEKVLQESGKYPIIGIIEDEIGLGDLPQEAQQQLISRQKFALQARPNRLFRTTRNKNFPTQQRIRGKLLFDLTIRFHLTLINREKRVDWEQSQIRDYKIISSRQRNIDEHEHQQQQFSVATFVEECLKNEAPTVLGYNRNKIGLDSIVGGIVKEIIAQNPTSVVFCPWINSDEFEDKIALGSVVSLATGIKFISELLSDYALGQEYVTNCLQSDGIRCHLVFACYSWPTSYDHLSTFTKAFCDLTTPLPNTYLHFIVGVREVSRMEKALQTRGFIVVTAADGSNVVHNSSTTHYDIESDDDSSSVDFSG